jgi:5'-deoxynucleotidase YfbR-like HD superfamily hydrolase
MKASSMPNGTTLLAGFSMLLAIMSLAAAFYQNYIQTKYVEAIQRNVSRAEYNRACRDLIEAYFQVKLKVGLIARAAERERAPNGAGAGAESMLEVEAANAISRFAALGTYLANFQNEDTRYQYTQLSWTLEKVLPLARNTAQVELAKLFEPADKLFAAMNDDCVRTAKAAPL